MNFPPSFFVLLVYAAGYFSLLFGAVCLACGLYYLAEIAEENTALTKKVIRYTLVVVLACHLVLWAYERFPFLYVAFGAIAHAVYWVFLLERFPFTNPKSIKFAACVALFVASNVSWFMFFRNNHELFYEYRLSPTPSVISFFLIMVWTVPTAFFVSL
eukprot:CAMPEP_0174905236 /NCGR_PEP_ID=MMETSP0167-20121228/52202_1 /TAXON_ID=38298 /ORGANISM="Rhodella maculata, Strain CCMP736" /LENGTH=157 /DNA_ID=CAMNT_0016148123 /DNA_START=37 /DNA_END=507 /DNA_ORIENTATION=-